MKHNLLHAIAHNLADSLANGVSFLIGYWETPVFEEAASSTDGIIEVDFLTGEIRRGEASENLRKAVVEFARVLPDFVARHGASAEDFEELSASFSTDNFGRLVRVIVADRTGRRDATNYRGAPLKRPKVLDDRGRPRPARRTPA